LPSKVGTTKDALERREPGASP
jgi:hypothetical protein